MTRPSIDMKQVWSCPTATMYGEDGPILSTSVLSGAFTGDPTENSTSLPSESGPDVWSGRAPDPIWPEADSPQQPILESVLEGDGLRTTQLASIPTTTSMGVPYPIWASTGLGGSEDWGPPSPSSPESSRPQQYTDDSTTEQACCSPTETERCLSPGLPVSV